MNLGESLNKLLSSFGIPTVVISIVFLVINIFKVFQPITLLSSNIFEQKLFSKERLFFVKFCKYLLYALAWMCIFYSISETLRDKLKWDYNEVVSICSQIILGGIFLFLVIVNEIQNPNRWFSKLKSKKLFKIIIVTIYLTSLFTFYIQFYLLIAFPQFKDLGMLIAVIIMFYVLCSAIPFISIPVLRLINWTTKKTVYIRDENNKKWFILYPINKEIILLGDDSDPKMCKKTKMKKLEDLYNEPILLKVKDN
ncbi:hypothetical protein ACP059_11075 [Bacillus cabrialesii]|uniref:hypothetical protein n=1 Tax=Bacillus cabrialesii TaxID=2487276 RepID=UPI003CF11B30